MIQILIHTLPQEIDCLEQILFNLKRNSNFTNEEFLVDVCLNLNLVNWEYSILNKEFFISKFKNLERITQTWAKTKFEVNIDKTIQGCVSHRRKAFKETEAEALLILDTDIIFSETMLGHLSAASKLLKEELPYYIVTPQITPMWDNSWDILVNEKYLNDGINFRDRDPYKYASCLGQVNVKPINGFKFGGGWAVLISANLVKDVPIPESLGHYGLEDTYIMYCSQIMKQNGEKINQFVLENEVIVEDHKFRFNPYKDYLILIDKREEFKYIANSNFENEIIKFVDSKK